VKLTVQNKPLLRPFPLGSLCYSPDKIARERGIAKLKWLDENAVILSRIQASWFRWQQEQSYSRQFLAGRGSEEADRPEDSNDSVSHKARAGHAKMEHGTIGAIPCKSWRLEHFASKGGGAAGALSPAILKTRKLIMKRSIKKSGRRAI
jgi:hypothetical protein